VAVNRIAGKRHQRGAILSGVFKGVENSFSLPFLCCKKLF